MQRGMKRIYLDVAKLITGDSYKGGCCSGIRYLCAKNSESYVTMTFHANFFIDVFKPQDAHINEYWYGPRTEENQLARSLALLFMAEMCDENS